MPDLKITRADLNERNEYVGDASGVDGHIIIEADLGTVLFKGAVRARLIAAQFVFTNSTRRFCARPASVALSATGLSWP